MMKITYSKTIYTRDVFDILDRKCQEYERTNDISVFSTFSDGELSYVTAIEYCFRLSELLLDCQEYENFFQIFQAIGSYRARREAFTLPLLNYAQSISLLSAQEAENVPTSILSYGAWWWLKDAVQDTDKKACSVSTHGDIYGVNDNGMSYVWESLAVRPVVTIPILAFMNIPENADLWWFGNMAWRYLGDGKIIYSDYDIVNHIFDKDTNNWDDTAKSFSGIKKYVHDRFMNRVLKKETTETLLNLVDISGKIKAV